MYVVAITCSVGATFTVYHRFGSLVACHTCDVVVACNFVAINTFSQEFVASCG